MAEKKATANATKKPEAKAQAAAAGGAKPALAATAAAAKPAPTPAPAAAKPASAAATAVAPGERRRLIAEAAYYLAQKRGFAPGQDVQDWLKAEREVDARLAARR